MLAALAPASLARMRFPLGELTKPRGARARRARPGCRSPTSPTRRTSASSPAPASAAFLARHGGLRERPGRDRRPRAAARLGRHRGQHRFTVGQRNGLGVGAPSEPLYVLAHRRAREHRRRRAARRAGARPRSRVRDARLHRPSGEVDARQAALPLAAARRAARSAGRRHARAAARRAGRRRRARPDRRACCAATWSSGTGVTIDRERFESARGGHLDSPAR